MKSVFAKLEEEEEEENRTVRHDEGWVELWYAWSEHEEGCSSCP